MAATKKTTSIETTILDKDTPLAHKTGLLMELCMHGGREGQAALKRILDAAAAPHAENIYNKKCQEVSDVLKQLQEGPLRSGTFFRALPSSNGNGKVNDSDNGKVDGERKEAGVPTWLLPRVHVLLDDGMSVYPVVTDAELAKSLRCGDQVLLDAQGKAVLFRGSDAPGTGEEARLERRIDRQRVEISLRDLEKHVFHAAGKLVERLDSNEVKPGDSLLICPRRMIAFDAVPREGRLSHYRYLRKESVPDVVAERDIGAPASFIEELRNHVYMEMTQPELGRRYRLPRCRMKLLAGVSGSGKTLSSLAVWRAMYEVMDMVTGVPIEKLPPRVLHLRSASVLSKWYGESEKHLDGFFDEVEQLAAETFIAPDGNEYELPLLVIGEEADALARSRGTDSVHDRVEVTLLQRLDMTSQKLKDKLILFLFTSNVPELVDPAFLRRAGGTIVRFDRLSRRACSQVLDKQLRDLPLRADDAANETEARQRVKSEILPWLYSPNGADQGIVEVTYIGATEPEIKHRRDFLTGALIARAVEEAAENARSAEWVRQAEPGVTSQQIMSALASQVQSIVDQLHSNNLHQYVSLPDGVRVGNVRRIPQPKMQPFELERSSL